MLSPTILKVAGKKTFWVLLTAGSSSRTLLLWSVAVTDGGERGSYDDCSASISDSISHSAAVWSPLDYPLPFLSDVENGERMSNIIFYTTNPWRELTKNATEELVLKPHQSILQRMCNAIPPRKHRLAKILGKCFQLVQCCTVWQANTKSLESQVSLDKHIMQSKGDAYDVQCTRHV